MILFHVAVGYVVRTKVRTVDWYWYIFFTLLLIPILSINHRIEAKESGRLSGAAAQASKAELDV